MRTETIIYIDNKYLQKQAEKILKTPTKYRSEDDRSDFWYVFNKLYPGFLGMEMSMVAEVKSLFFYHNIRVVAYNEND